MKIQHLVALMQKNPGGPLESRSQIQSDKFRLCRNYNETVDHILALLRPKIYQLLNIDIANKMYNTRCTIQYVQYDFISSRHGYLI